MCDPITIATVATVASAATGVGSAIMQHDAQRRASNQQKDAMLENLAYRDTETQVQNQQVNEQSAQQMSQRAREALVARGQLRAMMDSGNNSAARILAEQDYLESTDMATLESNRAGAVAQNQRALQSAARGTRQDLAALPYPTLLGTGLKIMGSVAGAAASMPQRPANKAGA